MRVRYGPGRPARFCNPACRVAAHRRRQQGLPETEARWSGPRGRLSLARAAAWEAAQAAVAGRRRERAHVAAQNRAWRRWRHAAAVADRLRVGFGYAPNPSEEAAALWREILAAERECVALGVPRVQPEIAARLHVHRVPIVTWEEEIRWAEQKLAGVTPPHLSRAELRRREREAAKAERHREVEERALEAARRALR
jgi:hypothetical protein